MAAIDPVAYLRSVPPFDALPPPLLDEAARSLEVSFHAAGTRLVHPGGEPLRHLYVIRKGAVRIEREGRTLQVLEEGEIFGYASLLKHDLTLDVVVDQDLVACRLPEHAFRLLLSDARFACHFARRVAERLRASVARSEMGTLPPDPAVEVQRIAPRAPVWVSPEASVGEAARIMRRERISSLLVRGDPPAILTDTDLRTRVLAEGRGPSTRVADVCSRPLRTVPATTPVHAAWARLLDAGVHHLPLARGEEIVGIVTSTDLLRHTAPGPIAVLREVERLESREGLPGYAKKVAELAASLVASGLDALVIGGLVARLNDALLRRILQWAEAEVGPPPAPYAWIVFGSEGRMEQTLLTDQDNALIYSADGDGPGLRTWARSVAERASADLQAAGFPPCPGGYMARSWHGPLPEWVERFRGWIEVPTPDALLVASIFFDFRRAAGALDLEPLEAVLAESRRMLPFLRLLARASLDHHPPARLLLRLRGESSIVDLKAQGTSPIVLLARCYGLEAGTRARSTVERLDAAARAGLVDDDERALVTEAFRFILGLRLRRQLEALGRGLAVTTQVALSDLTAMERTRLKEAFHAVETWHDHARLHYQLDF
jgi:CBS domain-containing protein